MRVKRGGLRRPRVHRKRLGRPSALGAARDCFAHVGNIEVPTRLRNEWSHIRQIRVEEGALIQTKPVPPYFVKPHSTVESDFAAVGRSSSACIDWSPSY